MTAPARHWYYIEVSLGSIEVEVIAESEAEAERIALPKLESELEDALDRGTWYVSQGDPVDDDGDDDSALDAS